MHFMNNLNENVDNNTLLRRLYDCVLNLFYIIYIKEYLKECIVNNIL